MFTEIAEWSEKLRNVQRNCEMFRETAEWSEKLRNVQRNCGMFREIAKCSEKLRNVQTTRKLQYIRKIWREIFSGKLENSDLNMCATNFLLLFLSVNVSIGTASSEYEKLFQDFLHGRMFGKRLMYNLLKPSQIS
jgi:NADH:ubiquinone oxidoreductase subunit D